MSSGYDRERLIELLKRDALRTGQFTLASGRQSHYYIDGRKVTLSAEGAAVIAEGVLQILEQRPGITAIGGLTMGADPIVGATLALAPERGARGCAGSSSASRPRRTAPANWSRGRWSPGRWSPSSMT